MMIARRMLLWRKTATMSRSRGVNFAFRGVWSRKGLTRHQKHEQDTRSEEKNQNLALRALRSS
jgi:hypothetical protein